jgi:hypothetical protein
MAVFIEKSPVTSSSCYKTIKTALILIKLGTIVDWTIAFVTTCSVLNFLLPWLPPPSNPQTEGGTSPFWQPPDVSFGHFF